MDLQTFMHNYYRPAHGPLVFSICIFGILTQALNIAVLTRRPMRTLPSNILLAGLSVAQLILLTNYVMGTIYVLTDSTCNARTKSYAWLAYLLFNVNVNVVFHTIALVHTTLLAVFRYAAVAFPIKCRKLVSDRGAKLAVILAFLMVPLACCTFYANSMIVERSQNLSAACGYDSESTGTLYMLRYTENRALRDYNFIFFGTVCKLLPCCVMIVLSTLLLLELKRVHVKRRALIGGANEVSSAILASTRSQLSTSNLHSTTEYSNRIHRQTTVMLVTVVLLLVCAEFPQGIMNLLTATLDSYEFSVRIYSPLGDLFEMLTVLYSSVNFLIYCAMSTQFRRMFKQLFYFFPMRNFCPVRNSVPESQWDKSSPPRSALNRRLLNGEYSTVNNDNEHRLSLLSPSPREKRSSQHFLPINTSVMYDSDKGALKTVKSSLLIQNDSLDC